MDECRLLVVDDDPATRGVISQALTDQGYEVVGVTNEDEAARRIERDQPALVLLHVAGAMVDGATLARELGQRGTAPPVLLLGGDGDGARLARQIGAAGYVPDPLNFGDLFAAVERICPLVRDRSAG